jgi:ubiquinone/menaquinone biosynthesis C-methylase UbiE
MSFTDRFTGRAGAYAAARPSYPPESIDAVLEGLGDPAALVVADIGAGTGISARAIAERGPRVLAIEPNAAMRANAKGDPRVEWIDGTGEATTLPDASVDVVAAFQAWHWVDHAAAAAEGRRIVRPGGRLAALYNERDESDPFTAAYGDIIRRYAVDATEQRRTDALEAFARIAPAGTHRFSFVNVHSWDREGLHKRIESTSYVPHAGPAAAAMRAEFDALFDRYAVDGSVSIHLVTLVVRVDV